jgi:hypothetical protein
VSAIDTIAELRQGFYRACGSVSDDDALVEQGEAVNDVAYIYLTRGIRAAQRFLIKKRMGHRWQKRSAAITWSGTEAADGGKYVALSTLASDFLRLNQKRLGGQSLPYGAIVEADGEPWGYEIDADESLRRGNFYYLKADKVWTTRGASPPTTAYLDYFYRHPALSAATASFDFPEDAMHLALWEAVDSARAESWFPLSTEGAVMIDQALKKARDEATEIGRQSRSTQKWKRPPIHGTRW